MNEQINSIENNIHNVMFEEFPVEAIKLLEQMDITEIVEILGPRDISNTLKIWERISPQLGGRVMELLPLKNNIEVLKHIDPNRGASLLNCLDVVKQEELLNELGPKC